MSKLLKDMRKCYKKKPYETLPAVYRAIAKAREQYGDEMHYYDCKTCGLYHLTKKKIQDGKQI